MQTFHKIINKSSEKMHELKDNSVDLTVTSPPYPMIKMWDEIFSSLNTDIKELWNSNEENKIFELMHKELEKIWTELYRVTKEGGIVCINIGDATRTIRNNFRIYMNSSKIISFMNKIGFYSLPSIIWRKATNSPTKFLGSGMLPCAAYPTLEHEHILIFRKGEKRKFSKKESIERRESAYFWEERNVWFSDLWNIKGQKQKNDITESREKTAAFPLEIPIRLISMFSKYNDVVLDPFWGTGTTSIASILLKRNSIGYEIDNTFIENFSEKLKMIKEKSININIERIENHKIFIKYKNNIKYFSKNINLPVVTKQEKEIKFYKISDFKCENNEYIFNYLDHIFIN